MPDDKLITPSKEVGVVMAELQELQASFALGMQKLEDRQRDIFKQMRQAVSKHRAGDNQEST